MMNKGRIKQTGIITFLLSAITVWTTGCNQIDSSLLEEDTLLRFRCDSVATRASGFEQTGSYAITSMGIYAAHTDGNWVESAPLNYMSNQQVARTDASSPWAYSPEAYWPGSGYASFFAYAPYDADNLTIDATSGTPELSFEVASLPADQTDLLVATPLFNLTKTSSQGYVNILLRHALTRISFAAYVHTNSNKLADIQITNIQLKGVHGKGTCPMDGKQRNWTINETTSTATYHCSNGSQTTPPDTEAELKAISLYKEIQDITTPSGYLFLMPQRFDDNATIEVTYSMDDVAQPPLTYKLNTLLPGWQAGESIRYLIAVHYKGVDEPVSLSLTPQFIPWENRDTDVDLDANPFLDITDINVSTYDAGITRIYFYTNQAMEDVYINPIGQNAVTGAKFQVKNEFCNIIKGDLLSDGTSNFFFDPNTHKGYVDLINLDTKTTGEGSNKGRQPVILTLHAGKLQRTITVQPVISPEVARNDETRYIGTFHRSNETGERIITWHAPSNVEWTATIDQVAGGDHSQLCIDRMASPDYQTGSLYSYSPRNPEGAEVAKERTTVSGKGRIYFRIGWKTIASTNRHARVKVTYNNGNSPDYLYCRQGEEPEELTPENRTNPFSVYNLKNDGVQVDYPTQGGLLSQWGRPREWAPIGTTSTPPIGYPSTVDTTLDLDVNICPVTYAYPDLVTINALKPALQMLPIIWGYYADGYFDRRSISSYRVEFTSTNVASAGILLYVKDNLHSVFMPTIGYRDDSGLLQKVGTAAGYWSKENGADNRTAQSMFIQNTQPLAEIGDYSKIHSFFMRCVKIMDPVTLYFDENGGDNAPRPVSVTKGTKAHIPMKLVPDNYWKDGYVFDSWNTSKDGSGEKYLPGNQYPSGDATSFTKDATLYAQWVTDPYIKVDYRKYVKDGDNPANYLLATSGSYDGYTIASNGNKYSSLPSDLSTLGEKAYPVLQFSPEFTVQSWTDAYTYCKEQYKEKNVNWRLPRAMELLLLRGTVLDSSIKDFKLLNNLIWSGTEASASNSWVINETMSLPLLKEERSIFRCVHELPR